MQYARHGGMLPPKNVAFKDASRESGLVIFQWKFATLLWRGPSVAASKLVNAGNVQCTADD